MNLIKLIKQKKEEEMLIEVLIKLLPVIIVSVSVIMLLIFLHHLSLYKKAYPKSMNIFGPRNKLGSSFWRVINFLGTINSILFVSLLVVKKLALIPIIFSVLWLYVIIGLIIFYSEEKDQSDRIKVRTKKPQPEIVLTWAWKIFK